jgi:hypothetical protein
MLILSNFCILCLLEKRVHKDGALCLPIEQGSFHCQLHFIDGLIGNTNFLEQGKFFFHNYSWNAVHENILGISEKTNLYSNIRCTFLNRRN